MATGGLAVVALDGQGQRHEVVPQRMARIAGPKAATRSTGSTSPRLSCVAVPSVVQASVDMRSRQPSALGRWLGRARAAAAASRSVSSTS